MNDSNETATQIARFAGDLSSPLTHGQRRDLVAQELAYITAGPRGTDYVLTDRGREILKKWRLAQR